MRPTKRHFRAEVATAHVEIGQPACGVGPRFSATADRALVTCEHGACRGVCRAPEGDGSQLAFALEARAELASVEVEAVVPKAAAVLSPEAVRVLAIATEEHCRWGATPNFEASWMETMRASVAAARAWLRENGGEVER